MASFIQSNSTSVYTTEQILHIKFGTNTKKMKVVASYAFNYYYTLSVKKHGKKSVEVYSTANI
jgi:hypothetical protein